MAHKWTKKWHPKRLKYEIFCWIRHILIQLFLLKVFVLTDSQCKIQDCVSEIAVNISEISNNLSNWIYSIPFVIIIGYGILDHRYNIDIWKLKWRKFKMSAEMEYKLNVKIVSKVTEIRNPWLNKICKNPKKNWLSKQNKSQILDLRAHPQNYGNLVV